MIQSFQLHVAETVDAAEWDGAVSRLGGTIFHSSIWARYIQARHRNIRPLFGALYRGRRSARRRCPDVSRNLAAPRAGSVDRRRCDGSGARNASGRRCDRRGMCRVDGAVCTELPRSHDGRGQLRGKRWDDGLQPIGVPRNPLLGVCPRPFRQGERSILENRWHASPKDPEGGANGDRDTQSC